MRIYAEPIEVPTSKPEKRCPLGGLAAYRANSAFPYPRGQLQHAFLPNLNRVRQACDRKTKSDLLSDQRGTSFIMKIIKNLSKNSLGALLLGLSVLAFSVMSTLVKLLGNDFNSIQIVFFRALFSLIIIAPYLHRSGTSAGGIRTSIPALQITRGLVGAIAITLSFYAIINLPLADALAIRFSSALFVVPLAALFLKEKIRTNKILASAVGFFGVLIMLNPQGNIAPAGLAALGGAIAFAFATILVSIVAKHDEPITMMFYSNIVAVLLLIGPAVVVWTSPSVEQFSLLFAMAICASIAHNLFIRAFAIAEASVIAPVDYVRLLLGAAIDYFIFGVVLGSNTLVGSILIVVTAFFILKTESGEDSQTRPAAGK